MKNSNIRKIEDYKDFATVFKVFEDYPFFESWSATELEEEFNMQRLNGEIFGYYIGRKCVGMISILPYRKGKHPVNFKNSKKVIYLSDIAVIHEYRGRGIASELLEYVLYHTKVLGYKTIYLRTNKDISMVYQIAVKHGFTLMKGVEQDVERIRIDGIVQKDTRIFLQKTL